MVRENIVRHVERGEDHYTAARHGTSEIGFAVLATTSSVIAVFVPVAFMKGIVGRFFFPFGITVAFAVLVSLFVSFTLDPMLSSLWYDPQAEGGAPRGRIGQLLERFNQLFRDLGRQYRRLIAWALDHRVATMGIAAAAFVAAMSLFGLGLVGGQFMPVSDQEQTALAVETPVGSSIDYTEGKALEIAKYLKTRPEVALTFTTIGGSAQNNAVNKGQIYIKMVPRTQRKLSQEQFETAIRLVVPQFKGVTARIAELGVAGGGQAPIQLNLEGPDLTRLQAISDRSLNAIRDVPGLVELKSSLEGRKPEFVVAVDRNLAADVGLGVGAIGAGLRPVLSGEKAGDWEDETGLAHDVIVRLAPEARTSETDIARVPLASSRIDSKTGAPVMVPLAQVATLRLGSAPDQIKRLLAAVGNEHLIRRNLRSRERELRGNVFLKRRVSAGRSELKQHATLRSEHSIDRAAKIIQREEISRGKRKRKRDAVAPLFKAAHFCEPIVAGHAVAAALTHRRDAGPHADPGDVQHHEHDRGDHADGAGDQERDLAGGFREQGAREG